MRARSLRSAGRTSRWRALALRQRRQACRDRLWDTLYGLLSTGQRAVLDSLLSVPPGARVSELDRLRRGPVRISGPQMKWALERAGEIAAFGMGEVDVSAIPPRRLAELSRYGIDGKASLLKRHGDSRRLATSVYLTSRAVDDALDLLEVLMTTKLPARAERETAKEKLKTLPRVERASAKLAAAFQIVFDSTSEQVDTDTGEITPPEVETLRSIWERIEQVVPRHELAAAIAALFELTPPLDSDADEAWRTQLVTRFGTVRPFLKMLVTVVDFGATPEGLPVLKALKSLPDLMGRKKVGPAEIDRVEAMLPRVGLPETLLEVFSWTGADQAFTSVTGGEARLKDLHVTIGALLVAHSCNVGYTPVIGAVDALKYGRLSHVGQTYLRLATYRAANTTLIDCQASVPLAQASGGGLVASVDGMRVRRARAVGVRPTESEALRAPGRRHLAQHD
jgi:hypothetical protein